MEKGGLFHFMRRIFSKPKVKVTWTSEFRPAFHPRKFKSNRYDHVVQAVGENHIVVNNQ